METRRTDFGASNIVEVESAGVGVDWLIGTKIRLGPLNPSDKSASVALDKVGAGPGVTFAGAHRPKVAPVRRKRAIVGKYMIAE